MIRIKGGRIIDPANGIDKTGDIYIQGSKIVSASSAKGSKVTTIDAKGKLVVPGLIDMHVHLREPGQEYKETIETGCNAAAAGGFTSLSCMPNTNPTIDNSATIKFIKSKAAEANGVNVFPMGAISKGLKGQEMAEIGDMVNSGAVAITDDGVGLMNSALMRSALEYSKNFDVTVCAHAEDMDLAKGGCMHEGFMSTKLGLKGITAAAESSMVGRDIELAEFTDAKYHVQHISTKRAVEMVKAAKKRGVSATCEAAPHHWSLTDEAVETYDSNFRMNPPLRSKEHVKAIKKGLKDGTIDVIATDHAPHAETDKKLEFDQALNGIIGLETALPLSLNLVREGLLDYSGLIAKLTINPANILGIEKGTLSTGADADVAIIDPDLEWVVYADELQSKSKNSPWLGEKMIGKAVVTIAGGKVINKYEK